VKIISHTHCFALKQCELSSNEWVYYRYDNKAPHVARFKSLAGKKKFSKTMYTGQKLQSVNRNVRWGEILQSANYC